MSKTGTRALTCMTFELFFFHSLKFNFRIENILITKLYKNTQEIYIYELFTCQKVCYF